MVWFFFLNIKIHVGAFRTKEEAIKARIETEKKYYQKTKRRKKSEENEE